MSKVCLCKGITEEQIIEAIKNGATSFEEVKEKTGAGRSIIVYTSTLFYYLENIYLKHNYLTL